MIRNRIALVAGLACSLALLSTALPSQAAVTLTSGNSFTQIDPTSATGQFNWFVDGSNELATQWFYVKIGAGAVVPISSLSAPSISQTSNSATFSYTGMGVNVQATFTLNGGAAGSGVSDMPISINVSNLTGTATPISIFEYANFNLNNAAAGDLLNIVTNTPAGFITQTKGATTITENNSIDAFNRWQGGDPASVLTGVLSGTLSNTPGLNTQIGPGDEAWAVQWNDTLAATGSIGSTFGVSKDEHIAGATPGLNAPEASSLAIWGLLGLTFSGAALGRRRAT